MPTPATEPLAFSLALFEHVCDYKQVYRALVGGRGGAVAVNELRRVIGEVVRRELADAPDDAIPQELRVEFVVSVVVTVLSWSFKRRPALPAERMNAVFRQLVLDGLGGSRSVG